MSERDLPPGWRSYKVKDRPLSAESERIVNLIRKKRLRELLRERRQGEGGGALSG